MQLSAFINDFMKKIIIILILMGTANFLVAYRVSKASFDDPQAYQQYNNWLKHGKFRNDGRSSQINGNRIVASYQNRFQEKPSLIIYLQDKKIVNIQEYTGLDMEQSVLANAQIILYILNTGQKKQINKLLNNQQISFSYRDYHGAIAVDEYIGTGKRITINEINYGTSDTNIKILIATNHGDVSYSFAPDINLHNLNLNYNVPPRAPDYLPITEKIKLNALEQTDFAYLNVRKRSRDFWDKNWKIDNFSPLEAYLFKHRHAAFNKKILNNRISSVHQFLTDNYLAVASSTDHKFMINETKTFQGFYSNILVSHYQDKAAFHINCDTSYQLINQQLILPGGEKIDCQELEDFQANALAPHLIKLIYQHRALSTDLFNFITAPAKVGVTLIMRGTARNLVDMDSYGGLLYNLHNYWRGREIYTQVAPLKKINGTIEFKLYLLAKDGEKFDFAELRFHLNKDLQIDVIMAIIVPDAQGQ